MVDPPTPPEDPGPSRIYLCFRDNARVACEQGLDGKWFRATRGVKRRHKADHLNFRVATQAIYDEMQAWAAAVRACDVTEKSTEVAV